MKVVQKNIKKQKEGIPDFFSLFDDLPAIDPFDDQKETIAIDLSALISHSGLSRAEFIEKSGWKQSRLSNVLSGRCNLTLKTISEVAGVLGCKFDVIYRAKNQKRAQQIWGIDHKIIGSSKQIPILEIKAQSFSEVVRDNQSGEGADIYFSLPTKETRLNRYFTPELAGNKPSTFDVIPMISTHTISNSFINRKVDS